MFISAVKSDAFKDYESRRRVEQRGKRGGYLHKRRVPARRVVDGYSAEGREKIDQNRGFRTQKPGRAGRPDLGGLIRWLRFSYSGSK